MKVDLSGRTALVAGGARGIGRATAESLAAAGARVYLGDLDGDAALQAASELCAAGFEVSALRLDVTSYEGWQAVQETILAERGRLDILVYAAGIFPPATLEETEPALFQKVQDINCTGFYSASRVWLPVMAAQGQGVAVAIGSTMTTRANPGMLAYCVSKAGLGIMCRCLAQQYARDGVRVNCVNPGWVDTPGERSRRESEADWQARAAQFIPAGRLQSAREVGDTVTFLCSDQAASINGVLLNVDGAISAR